MVKSKPMDTWVVISTGGKQYKVCEGNKIAIEKVGPEKDGQIVFRQVLLVKKGDDLIVGNPYVEHTKVVGKILGNFRDKKIRVVKFKSKSRYLRTRGHRQEKTEVLIEKIQL